MLCLTVPSDPAWADAARGDLDAVLVDHAHCEMKAASNALSLAARHPENSAIVLALTDLAREEISHFQEVLGWLARRRVALGPPPKDLYAAELRRAAHELGRSRLPPLVDRLLVGALIEARSCERFKLLARALDAPEDVELRAFYERLLSAEAGHFRTFVELAILAAGGADADAAVAARLGSLAALEGDIVRALPLGGAARASMHG